MTQSNPPAFPSRKPNEHFTFEETYFEGLSLRDYFAAVALQGYLASFAGEGDFPSHYDNAAVIAYTIADAMLKAR